MRSKTLVEACVTSASEAAACAAGGARRVELCRDLHVGGLTPPKEQIRAAQAASPVPVFVLVRSEPDTFRATPGEAARLVDEVSAVAGLGVDGIVAGALDRRGHIDPQVVRDLVSAADGLPVTFHRAFDEVTDPLRGIELLVDAGVARVLTSGGPSTAWEGRYVLRELVRVCSGRLTVLGGGGVRGDHVRRLVEEAGLAEVHARASVIDALVEALAPRPARSG